MSVNKRRDGAFHVEFCVPITGIARYLTAMDLQNDKKERRSAPPGWVSPPWLKTFSAHAGPFYFREEGGPPGVGFYAEPHHGNIADAVHGGMLMTLADMSLFDIAMRAASIERAVTVTMNAEFVGPGRIGDFIEATGELVKEGGSLLFLRGMISSNGNAIMSFSGTLKRSRSGEGGGSS